MKTVDKIIAYMEMKRELSHPRYMYPEDEIAIRQMSVSTIKNIWMKICITGDTQRFGTQDCPFCIDCCTSCSICSYARRHGKCAYPESDWATYISPSVFHGATLFIKSEISETLRKYVDTLNSFKHVGDL